MEEGQERDSSPDEQRHIIDDDDIEDSPTDTPDLWISERNEEDTMFVRVVLVRYSENQSFFTCSVFGTILCFLNIHVENTTEYVHTEHTCGEHDGICTYYVQYVHIPSCSPDVCSGSISFLLFQFLVSGKFGKQSLRSVYQ
jgi:hypothetical protein